MIDHKLLPGVYMIGLYMSEHERNADSHGPMALHSLVVTIRCAHLPKQATVVYGYVTDP